MKNVILFSFLALSGCASTPLTPDEQNVRILRKSDAPATCKELGKVHAPGMMSVTEEGRDADLKRAAYTLGANTVTTDRRDENNTVYGTAFKCD